jgi:hypothetical protein
MMINGRTPEELKTYDRNKLLTAIGLALCTLGVGFMGTGQPASSMEPKPAIVVPGKFAILEPAAGTELAAGAVKFKGTGKANQTVVLLGDGAEMSRATVAADGAWTFDLNVMPPYPQTLVAKLMDGDQVVDTLTLDYKFGKANATGEHVFAIARPTDNGIVAKGKWVIAGTGTPGRKVFLAMDKWPLGVAPIMEDGTWTFPREIFKAGERRLLKATEQADGKDLETKSHTISVTE